MIPRLRRRYGDLKTKATNDTISSDQSMTHPYEEMRLMKEAKEHFDMLGYVADAHYGIPTKCPCGGRIVDEQAPTEGFDTLPGKSFFTCKDYKPDGLHFRQPWATGVQQEVLSLAKRLDDDDKIRKEAWCEIHKLKVQVAALKDRVADLEQICYE